MTKKDFKKKMGSLSPLEKNIVVSLIEDIYGLVKLNYTVEEIIDILQLPINRK